MGEVVDLRKWREGLREDRQGGWRRAHEGSVTHEAVSRLEQAVHRLDPAVSRVTTADGTVDPRVETELLAITGAVSLGRTDEASHRAELLADRLEHPTARRPG